MLAPWLFGLALGALHPIGLLMAITGLAVFLYFASALGTLFSLRSKTSGQALARTLGVLLMVNLGTVVVGVLVVGSKEFGILFGNTALLLYYLPISTHFMQVIVAQPGKGGAVLGLPLGLRVGLCVRRLDPLPGRGPRDRPGRQLAATGTIDARRNVDRFATTYDFKFKCGAGGIECGVSAGATSVRNLRIRSRNRGSDSASARSRASMGS